MCREDQRKVWVGVTQMLGVQVGGKQMKGMVYVQGRPEEFFGWSGLDIGGLSRREANEGNGVCVGERGLEWQENESWIIIEDRQ